MIYDVRNLEYSYVQRGAPILCKVSFTLEEGELLTVLGRNGVGKSTLFSCLMGINKPQGGEIYLQGKALSSLKEKDIASVVGFVPQAHEPTFGFSVFDFVLMGCASKIGLFEQPGKEEKKAAYEALERMGIEKFADRSYAELSGGERQQVTIARAIASKPKAILFDEPTAHLDYSNQLKVLRVIKDLTRDGYAVAVTTHDPNHALLLEGSTALFRPDGSLICGSTAELVTEDNLKQIYGSDLKIRYMEEFGRRVCIYPSL